MFPNFLIESDILTKMLRENSPHQKSEMGLECLGFVLKQLTNLPPTEQKPCLLEIWLLFVVPKLKQVLYGIGGEEQDCRDLL